MSGQCFDSKSSTSSVFCKSKGKGKKEGREGHGSQTPPHKIGWGRKKNDTSQTKSKPIIQSNDRVASHGDPPSALPPVVYFVAVLMPP